MPTPDYTCEDECGEPTKLYRVTNHEGAVTICAYCDDCAELAGMDWNGETAKIEPVEPVEVPPIEGQMPDFEEARAYCEEQAQKAHADMKINRELLGSVRSKPQRMSAVAWWGTFSSGGRR